VILLGHSWGAWLSLIYASVYPEQVKKIILVGCPPFQHSEVAGILKTRMNRLDRFERSTLDNLQSRLKSGNASRRNLAFTQLGKLIERADAYNPLRDLRSGTNYNYDQYLSLWEEAYQIRKNGEFVKIIRKINCPIFAIQGNYDPHPAVAVKTFIPLYHKDFRMVILEKCGHEPWREKYARDLFFEILKKEITNGE